MRMNVAGNWFKLNDPEHLVFHTKRMMERDARSRRFARRPSTFAAPSSTAGPISGCFSRKLAQLEAMLPMQSKVVQLPFDNSASGFDLFSEGATAPGSRADRILGGRCDQGTRASAYLTASAALSRPLTPATGVSLTTSTTAGLPPLPRRPLPAGPGSIADIFVFGKYISLLDTRVIAGGRSAAFEILSREVVHVQIPANVIPTTTEEGKTYVEIFLSTPNGISNSLLVPYQDDSKQQTPSDDAYKLADKSQALDVYYQWFTASGGTTSLIPTYDPGEGSHQDRLG